MARRGDPSELRGLRGRTGLGYGALHTPTGASDSVQRDGEDGSPMFRFIVCKPHPDQGLEEREGPLALRIRLVDVEPAIPVANGDGTLVGP